MHITLSPTQQVTLVHEENQPGEFTTTVTSANGDPFEMVLVDGPTFLELGDEKINFQQAKGTINATVKSEGDAWYLIARAEKPTEISVETTFSASVLPREVMPAAANEQLPPASPPAPINWMLIAAIALIVLLIGYFLYTQFFAPKPSAVSKLRSL